MNCGAQTTFHPNTDVEFCRICSGGTCRALLLIAVLLLAFAAKYERAIVNGVVYCEPKAYDLKTGKPVEWNWPWAKDARRGCGTLSASASCFFFRSDTTQTFDLASGKVKPITTESRPG